MRKGRLPLACCAGFAQGLGGLGSQVSGGFAAAGGDGGVGLGEGHADGDRVGLPVRGAARWEPDRADWVHGVPLCIGKRCVGLALHSMLSAFIGNMVIIP